MRLSRNAGAMKSASPDGRPSRFFYWDDEASQRLRPELLTGEQALEQAKAAAQGITGEPPC